MKRPSLKPLVLLVLLAIACGRNAVPDAPVISGPNESHPEQIFDFVVSGVDPEGDSVKYLVDWRDGSEPAQTGYVSSGSNVTFTHAFTNPGTYPIRARSIDTNNDSSVWSAEHRFNVFQKIDSLWHFVPNQWSISSCVEFPKPPVQGPGGMFYVSFYTKLCAVDANGLWQWEFSDSGQSLTCPSVADDGTIYVGTTDGYLIALNPDGTTRWSYATSGRNQLTPCAIAKDGTIYFGSMDSFFYALKPDGQLKWKYNVNDCAGGTPAIGPSGNIYFAADGGRFLCLNPAGIRQWSLQWNNERGCSLNRTIAITRDERIFFLSLSLFAISKDGEVEWMMPLESNDMCEKVRSAVVGLNGTIYTSTNQYFLAISPGGSVLWKYPKNCGGPPSVTRDGSIVLAMHSEQLHDDEVYVFSAAGDACSRTDSMGYSFIGNAPLIDQNGVIYVVGVYPSQWQILYAVNGTSPLANTDWPMYQHDPRHTGRAGD